MSHLLIFHQDLKTRLPSANIISEISYVKLQNYYMIKGQKDKHLTPNFGQGCWYS